MNPACKESSIWLKLQTKVYKTPLLLSSERRALVLSKSESSRTGDKYTPFATLGQSPSEKSGTKTASKEESASGFSSLRAPALRKSALLIPSGFLTRGGTSPVSTATLSDAPSNFSAHSRRSELIAPTDKFAPSSSLISISSGERDKKVLPILESLCFTASAESGALRAGATISPVTLTVLSPSVKVISAGFPIIKLAVAVTFTRNGSKVLPVTVLVSFLSASVRTPVIFERLPVKYPSVNPPREKILESSLCSSSVAFRPSSRRRLYMDVTAKT